MDCSVFFLSVSQGEGTNGDNDGEKTRDSNLQTELPFLSYEKCRHWSVDDFKHLTGISQDSFEIL